MTSTHDAGLALQEAVKNATAAMDRFVATWRESAAHDRERFAARFWSAWRRRRAEREEGT